MAIRPSKSNVDAFRRELSDWINVACCETLVADFLRNHGDFERGLRGGKLWRECFHALRFAREVQAEALKIGSDPPDFEFRLADNCIQVELVVARDVDDCTSQQFVQDANFIGPRKANFESIGDNALNDSWESLPSRIAAQVEAKSRKGYATSFVLAIAASSFWWPNEQESMESAILECCLPFISSFKDIWILAGEHFISLNDARISG